MLKRTLNLAPSGPQSGTPLMYENDGAAIFAAVIEQRKQKLVVFNDRGREVELDPKRAYILSQTPIKQVTALEERALLLKTLRDKAAEVSAKIELPELWELLVAEPKEFTVPELSELCLGAADGIATHTAVNVFAMWLSLLNDRVFFKRGKDGFTPRNVDTVTALKLEKQRAVERDQQRQLIIKELHQLKVGDTLSSPTTQRALLLLKQLAAGYELNEGEIKEARELADLAAKQFLPGFNGRPEDAALGVLDHLNIFNERTNLHLIRHAVSVGFDDKIIRAASVVTLQPYERADLTSLEAFTVDDASTLDIDDALSWRALGHGYELGIHISDVSSHIEPNSVLEQVALDRSTSLYFPDGVIPMLPESLSHDLLSLRVGQKRAALSYLLEYSPNLELRSWRIVPSFILSRRRLTYEELDHLLEHGDEVMTHLNGVAQNHESKRLEAGASKVNKQDAQVKIREDGGLELAQIDEHSPARNLVAEMMVLANQLSAEFAIQNNIALIFRAQETTGEDPHANNSSNLPDGPAKDYAIRSRLKRSSVSCIAGSHATLGLKAYAQLTSPIRRAHDLVNQRQILSVLINSHAFYSPEQITGLIQHCEGTLARANIVSRESKRFWLLKYLEQQRIQGENVLSGIVTRNDLKTPLVEIEKVHLPLPVRFNQPVRVGSSVQVRIAALDARREIVRLEGI